MGEGVRGGMTKFNFEFDDCKGRFFYGEGGWLMFGGTKRLINGNEKKLKEINLGYFCLFWIRKSYEKRV